jgi:hypothetical protein
MDKEIPEMKNHTFTASCKGVKIAEAISRILIHESRWFSVDPLPGDEYAFEVHTDASFLLRKLINGELATWDAYGGYPQP